MPISTQSLFQNKQMDAHYQKVKSGALKLKGEKSHKKHKKSKKREHSANRDEDVKVIYSV